VRHWLDPRHPSCRALPAAAAIVALSSGAAAAGAQAPVAAVPKGAMPTLRVCADPNNLPFSNEKREGFENRLAERIGKDLGAPVAYVWRPQRRGFARTTLNAGLCDIIMGVPVDYGPARATNAYYRSTYVFVYRKDRGYHLKALTDTALRHLTIGVHLVGDDGNNPPPAHALAALGIIGNLRGYSLFGDYSQPNPPARLIEDVAAGKVDVGIVWGPLAGYFAKRQRVPLVVVPVDATGDRSGQVWTYSIALAVRRRDSGLAAALDRILVSDRAAIRRILDDYGVPQLPMVDAGAPGGEKKS
jgi:quinoprotein dehydrogenase-associated probable ABC transporter substrate-binding protein